jgi:hypothetical protein
MPDVRPAGAIATGRISVSGGLLSNPERTVTRMKNGFLACIAGNGTLVLDVLVADNGSVLSATATDAADFDRTTVDCIERRAQAATFRPPVGGQAHVTFRVTSGSWADGG